MRSRLAAVLLGLAVATPAVPAAATDPGASLRLVVAGSRDGRPDLGLEIALAPGWKTYWRQPGDAGLPPVFDVSASRGLAGFTVRFPVPERFEEAGLVSIGYTKPVVLPIDIAPADPAKPVDFDLVVHLGLCREVCVPLEAHLTATLDPAASPDPTAAARLAAARAALPVAATATAAPRIVSIRRHDDTTPPSVSVEVREPPSLPDAAVDLLVEGPTPDWALPQPTMAMRFAPPPSEGAAGTWIRVWEFALDGAPAKADLRTAPLRFTLRAGSAAVEQTVGLDGSGILP